MIAAAARSFFDVGYEATAIEQVAADAGVSKVTVYNHFGDKRSLFGAAVEYECERMRGLFEMRPASSGSLVDRLTVIGEAMSAFLSRPELVRFDRRVAAETEHDPEIGRAFLNAGPHRMKGAFAGLLESLVEAGELEIDDCAIAAEQFVSMVKGMGDLERRFGMERNEEVDRARIEGAVEVFLAAYAAA
ncbi:TetR/AcrR family transcriptional regulator [Altererythrobacter arenosus]|uniref:TetR/AcrR family transcriptional regulator n=1 Tax=Altererythrobacter arenosus TaxID=3032592 RepID=A0ABY8FLU4_9SPHN|nr:TetR/AcrR family transcriptional regulator [Altererythrobacter sp. CAU 1644]WFL75988.1 TetR/AcrR family transcriptional regulator [Altererythrobacter sp. CAU 1644]